MNKNKIKEGFLINLADKKNVYLLGLIWADGFLYDKKYKRVSLELKANDFNDIEPILTSNGINCIYVRKRLNSSHLQKSMSFNDIKIFNFLKNNDYHIKSGTSPDKILKEIPENLKYYWWRGYFDGDGCLYIKTKNQLAFWSTITQDWSFLKNLFHSLDICYYTTIKYSRKNTTHLSSSVEIRKMGEIKLMLEYIYKNYDGIGISRKYSRYLEFLDKYLKSKVFKKTSSYKYICFNNNNKKWGSFWKGKYLGWFDSELEAINKQEKYIKDNNIIKENEIKTQEIDLICK